jgi:hypothetical protein
MEISTKKVPYTGQELLKVIDFLTTKEKIGMAELQKHFNKDYQWAMCIMETLEDLNVVEEFKGERERVVVSS